MTVERIDDHIQRAIDALPAQWQDDANVRALAAGLASETQPLEDAIYTAIISFHIDTAVGVQLDLIGSWAGRARNGQDDEEYRRHIRAQIVMLRSSGRGEELLKITRLILGQAGGYTASTQQYFPGAVVIEILDMVITLDVANVLIEFLVRAVAAGVRVCLKYGLTLEADAFTFAPSTGFLIDADKGLGDTSAPASGGAFWSIQCAYVEPPPPPPPMLVLMDRIVVSGAAVQSVTFGPGGDGDVNPTLDGEHYVIKGALVPGATMAVADFLEIRPNGTSLAGVGANGHAAWSNLGAPAALAAEQLFRATGQRWIGPVHFDWEMVALPGIRKTWNSESWQNARGSVLHEKHFVAGTWEDTATAITSFVIQGSAPDVSDIGVGSVFTLYKVQRVPA